MIEALYPIGGKVAPWHIFQALIMGLCSIIMIGALIMNAYRDRIREAKTVAVVCMGMSSVSLHPISITSAFVMNVIAWNTAPVDVAIVKTVYTVFSVSSVLYFLFPAYFWHGNQTSK